MRIFFSIINLLFFAVFFFACNKNDEHKPAENLWVKLSAPNVGEPQDIKFINADTGYILGTYYSDTDIHDILIKTNDGGSSWQTIILSNKYLLDTFGAIAGKIYVSPFNSNILFSGGQNLVRSVDAGYTWQKVDTVNKKGSYNAYFFDPIHGVGSGKNISKTADSGFNWTEVYNQQSFAPLTMLQFTSSLIGYASGGFIADASNFGLLVKTIDGGNTWQNINYPFKAILGMYFLSNNVGYVSLNTEVSDIATTYYQGCEILKTEDGGATWNSVNKTIYEDYKSHASYIYFRNTQEGFFSGETGVFYTNNEGKDWQKILDNPDYTSKIILLSFPDNNTCYAIKTDGTILKQKLN